jgi:aldehyde dehydrogenase (NAD+)
MTDRLNDVAGARVDGNTIPNGARFGRTAGIATRSLARARGSRGASRPGCVMVGLPAAGTAGHVPFGSRRASSGSDPYAGAAA